MLQRSACPRLRYVAWCRVWPLGGCCRRATASGRGPRLARPCGPWFFVFMSVFQSCAVARQANGRMVGRVHFGPNVAAAASVSGLGSHGAAYESCRSAGYASHRCSFSGRARATRRTRTRMRAHTTTTAPADTRAYADAPAFARVRAPTPANTRALWALCDLFAVPVATFVGTVTVLPR